MAGVPIQDLVPLLTSNKIKARNDAVAALGNISIHKLKCSVSELFWLIEALYKGVKAEHSNLSPSASAAATMARAREMSSFLRDLVEHYTKLYPRDLNLKICDLILYQSTCLDYIADDKEEFSPCIGDLAKTATTALANQAVASHISSQQWLQCLDFFVGGIENKLRPHSKSENKDNILTNLFSGMHTLLGADTLELSSHLVQEKVRNRILGAMKTAVDYSDRRESAIVVIILKLVNKFMVLLATESWSYTSDVVSLGMKIAVRFANTHLETLMSQIALFLNLETLHCFLKAPSTPNEPEGSDPERRKPSDVTSYTIGVLIQSLLKKLHSSPVKLSKNNIQICIKPQIRDFHHLTTIACSNNEDLWLLMCGLATLVKTYYASRPSNVESSASLHLNANSASASDMTNRKRQKLDWNSMMISSNTPLSFYNSIINASDDKMCLIGIQLAIFHFELENFGDSQKPTTIKSHSAQSISDSEDILMLDLTSDSDSETCQIAEIFDSFVKIFNDQKVPYWPLLACHSLLAKVDSSTEATKSSLIGKSSQLMRLLIPLVKDPSVYLLASSLLYEISYFWSKDELDSLIGEEFRLQLENLVETSAMAGPCYVDKFSFKFWKAVAEILTLKNSRKLRVLASKIGDWFGEKWEASVAYHSMEYFAENSSKETWEFILWIADCPSDINIKFPTLPERKSNEFYSAMKECSFLMSFISFGTRIETVANHPQSTTQQIPASIEAVNVILDAIRTSKPKSDEDNEKCVWAVLLMNIASGIEESFSSVSKLLQEEARGVFDLHFSVTEDEKCGLILRSLPNATAAEIIAKEVASTAPTQSVTSRPLGKVNEYLDFDLQSRKLELSPELEVKKSQDTDFTKFKSLMLYRCHDYQFDFMKRMSPACVLKCVDHYARSLSSRLMNLNPFLAESLVRQLGEGPLSCVEFERASITVKVTCTFLRALKPYMETSGWTEDCLDLVHYLLRCLEGNFFLDERILVEVYSMWFELSKFTISPRNDETLKLTRHFLSHFATFSNDSKMMMLQPLVNFFATKETSSFVLQLFQGVRDSFGSESLEYGATKILFMAEFSRMLPQFAVPVLTDLIKIDASSILVPYAKESMSWMQLTDKEGDSTTSSSRHLKLEALKSLWLDGVEPLKFPFRLFSFVSQEDFVLHSYRQIVAVVLATESSQSKEDTVSTTLNFICKLKDADLKTIVADSLPFIVPLAYSVSGVRNTIFQKITKIFKEDTKRVMKESLTLIILECFRSVDVESEAALREVVKNPRYTGLLNSGGVLSSLIDLGEVLSSYFSTHISPKACVELIDALMVKYEGEMSPQLLYFYVRSLGIDASSADELRRKSTVRRIKFSILATGVDISTYYFAKLFVELHIASTTHCFNKDFLSILCLIQFSRLKQFEVAKQEQLVLQLLAILIPLESKGLPEVRTISARIIQALEENAESFRSVSSIVASCAKKLLGKHATGSTRELEKLFLDSSFWNILENHRDDIIIVLSNYFDSIEEPSKLQPKVELTRVMMDLSTESSQSESFQLWISEYLAAHYISGISDGAIGDLIDIQPVSVYEWCGEVDKTLDFVANAMAHRLDQGNYSEAAFVESCMSGLISNAHNFQDVPPRYMYYFDMRSPFKDYLPPIESRSCIMLNDDYVTFTDVWLQKADYFTDLLEKSISNVEEWTTMVSISILKGLAKETNHAYILAYCISKIPSLAKEILPQLSCFAVKVLGQEMEELVEELISIFWKNFHEPYCQEGIEVIRQLAIHVRSHAIKEKGFCKSLYDRFDHEALALITAESQSSESALLFFDDFLIRNGNLVNWHKHQRILCKLYLSLGEADLLEGIPSSSTLSQSLEMKYEFLHSSERARYSSGLLDASLALDHYSNPREIIHSLSSDGMLGVSKLLNEDTFGTKSFEWSWKLNSWESPPPSKKLEKHDVIYSFFKRVKDEPTETSSIYSSTMRELVHKPELANDVHREAVSKCESWLQTLAIVSTCNSIFKAKHADPEGEIISFQSATKWFEGVDSSSYEDLLLARRVAQNLLNPPNTQASQISKSTDEMRESNLLAAMSEIVRFNDLSRKERSSQKMVSSCILLEQFVQKSKFVNSRLDENAQKLASFHAAQTLWAEGKANQSTRILSELDEKGDISLPFTILSVSNQLIKAHMAVWMAESRLDLGNNILANVVNPMKSTIEDISDLEQQSAVYHLLAQFCEHQFKSQNLRDRITELEERVNGRKTEIDDIKSHYGKTSVSTAEKKTVQKYYGRLKSQAASESRELESLMQTKLNFGRDAASFFLRAISMRDAEDEDVDKFFSLFFELAADEDFQIEIAGELENLETYKALSWCTQLLSRITDENGPFQSSIKSLIVRICEAHPFHSLYYLISLIYHETVAEETFIGSMASRVEGAKTIRTRLMSVGDYNSRYLLHIEKFCRESVALAEMKAGKGRTLHLDKLKIGTYWTSPLPPIPPPTLEIPVSRNGYRNVPLMESVSPTLKVAPSGLSLPKIADFRLTNHREHTVLFKHGTDDLRQDAIMEQVFGKVNKFLSKDREARLRQLRVRTYNAVPLGPKAGLIEFVPNSKALIEVIKPFHQETDKLRVEKARDMMKRCQTEDLHERIGVYQEIEKKIQPVLHRFFLETFTTPESWFESRKTYTRGVAATSIVGHILGLGDRHCNNILLDEHTGEPVHIDLGVAFDQGKRLPIPETVPFRLTRDIVDGFGFMGTNGPFSISCEHTYRVLRRNEEHILAILDVLRWDPLYSWSISPIRKLKVQNENEGLVDLEVKQDGSEAATAILTVIEKLSARGLSVEATVRDLIREATSKENLAAIYCGWCPFF